MKALKIGFLFGLLIIWLGQTSFIVRTERLSDTIKLIVIDPGHGGKDPGASGSKAKEKDLTLKMGLKLKKILNANDAAVKVEMTRDTDVFVGLTDRAKFANTKKADLYISIHFNANNNKEVHGTETYALGVHKADANFDVMKRENETILMEDNYKEKYDDFNPKSEESYIMFKIQQHAFHRQSLHLADCMEKEFVATAKRSSRGARQAGFLVLWQTSMPAILIETGFVTNAAEEKFFLTDTGCDLMAKAMYNAIQKYKKGQGN